MLSGHTVASAGTDVKFDEDNCTVDDIATTGAVRYVRAYYPTDSRLMEFKLQKLLF